MKNEIVVNGMPFSRMGLSVWFFKKFDRSMHERFKPRMSPLITSGDANRATRLKTGLSV